MSAVWFLAGMVAGILALLIVATVCLMAIIQAANHMPDIPGPIDEP